MDMNNNETETVELQDWEKNPLMPIEEDLAYPGEEEWELSPKYPEAEHLLYPGQDILEMELDYLDDEKQEDKLWQARTGLDFETLCGAIETVIFMSDKPLALAKIKNLIDEDLPLRVIHQSIERLQEEYEMKHHGLRLVEVADGYQFRTKATYSKYVQDLFKVNSLVLSPTALEVLAIISYKQPVAKTEVDKIRGVDSGHIVRGLMDKRLVKVVGRSDEVGRPVLYGTTPEFLEVFNLPTIDHLPPEHELEEMLENQSVGKISEIKNIVHTGDKEAFKFDEIDELDELSETIKSINPDTDFTKSLKSENKKATKEVNEGEQAPQRRSAFDLLEEYVNKQIIINANVGATESEMMSGAADPLVIGDLTAGPFNAPEVMEEEEDDFQMIDLDTGLPIEEEAESDSEGEELEAIDLLSDGEDEAAELAAALDEAFEKLTGETLSDDDAASEELALDESRLADTEESLEDLNNQIVEEAKDLDLDLSFLADESSENNDLDGEKPTEV